MDTQVVTTATDTSSLGDEFDEFLLLETSKEKQSRKYKARMESYRTGKAFFEAGEHEKALPFLKKVVCSKVLEAAETRESKETQHNSRALLLQMSAAGFVKVPTKEICGLARKVTQGEYSALSEKLKGIFAHKPSHGNAVCKKLFLEEVKQLLPEIVAYLKKEMGQGGFLVRVASFAVGLIEDRVVAQMMDEIKLRYKQHASQHEFFGSLYGDIAPLKLDALTEEEEAQLTEGEKQKREQSLALYEYAAGKIEAGRVVYCRTHFSS